MRRYAPLFYCLVLGTVMITISSTCSFLFATNSWSDVNCIFTASRCMVHGRVLYRDVMDHKGFYLYIINILGYLISRRSFLGLYVMECLFFSAFLYASYCSFRLYLSRFTSACLLSLLGAAVSGCAALEAGGCTEEFALPFAAVSLYFMLRYVKEDCDASRMNGRVVFLNGVLAGVVFWMKYTMLGLWFGFMAMVFFLMLSKKEVKRAFLSCLVFLGGMGAASVPPLFYFGVNGALKDCFQVYFYNNLFLYPAINSDPYRHFHSMCSFWLRHGRENPVIALFAVGGLMWVLFCLPVGQEPTGRKQRRDAGLAIRRCVFPFMYLCLVTGIYWGTKDFRYYYLITAPFMVFGLLAFGGGWEHASARLVPTGVKKGRIVLGVVTLSVVWGWFACSNADVRLQKWEDTEQYHFASIMSQSENPTLQVYGFMDRGFYNALDIIPAAKYFTFINFTEEQMPEMYAQQREIVRNQEVEYVICREEIPSFILERYHPVSDQGDSELTLLKRNEY